MLLLHQLIKHAGDLPMWIRVPGMPFNIPIPGERKERLSGMREWVPIDTIERVRRGREKGVSPEEIVAKERDRTNAGSAALSGAIGGASGGLLARVIQGEKGVAPFKEIAEKGLTKKTLLGLKSLPLKMRLLPAAGASIGALSSILQQKSDSPIRERGAREALRGLAVEDLQTQNELMNAVKSVQDLKEMKKESMDDTSATLLAAGAGGLGGYAAGTQMAKLLPIGGAAVGALLLAALVASMRKNNRPEPAWSKSAASTSFAARSGGAGKNYGKVTEDPPMPGPGADGSKSQFKTPSVSAASVSKVTANAVGAAGGALKGLKMNKGTGSISNG